MCSPPGVISGLPFPFPGDLPNPWIKSASLMSPALTGGFFITSATWEPKCNMHEKFNIKGDGKIKKTT